MRDTHDGMPEILNSYQRGEFYFGVVRIVVSDDTAAFEFGVDYAGYIALRKVLQTRPFSNIPGIEYRYFYAGPSGYLRRDKNEAPVTYDVRIEQGEDARKCAFRGPTSLVSNLIWFMGLKNLNETSQLKRIE